MDNDTRNKLRPMHSAIAKAISDAMESDATITPNDIGAYFSECLAGVRLSLCFKPDRETFLNNLRFEE